MTQEIKKILLSLLFSFIITVIFEYIISIPEEVEKKINDILKEKEKNKITKA